jgi:hypothetical protein
MKNTSGPSKAGPFAAIPRKREVAITKTIQPVQNRPATKDSKKNHFIKLPSVFRLRK